MVLLHGWLQDHTTWRALVEFARAGYRCVALDLPGIGGPRMTDLRGDKRFLTAVVHEVVETLELPRPVVVGHDIGGMVAYAYLRSQHDVRAVVLVDTVVPGL